VKLGFLTGELAAIEKAARLGFSCVELECSALGDPRTGPLDRSLIDRAAQAAGEHGVEIAALAYYGLASFDPPSEEEIELTYDHVFAAAETLGVAVVGSMSGFDASRDWAENLELFTRRFGALAARASERGLRLALENWMGFWGQLPFRPINMGGSPATWAAWFDAVPDAALGLEFDPSHLLWQGIDPVRALREFSDRVYSFHAKDVELLPEARYRHGVNGDTFRFRIPGYGGVDWVGLTSALVEARYEGGVVIEHEDEVFGYTHDRGDRYDEGLRRGKLYLDPLVRPWRDA
jgi:sugar phosphate isomerase/epimerase